LNKPAGATQAKFTKAVKQLHLKVTRSLGYKKKTKDKNQ